MASAKVAAVLVAAGRGMRAGGDLPKQYRRLGGRPVIRLALEALAAHPRVAQVQPVIHPDDAALFTAAAAGLETLPPVAGGASRQGSVRAGLEALAAVGPPEIVLVHDAARPFASASLIDRAIEAAARTGAAVPGLPVVDAVKTVDADMRVEGDAALARERLRLVQTPQAFAFGPLLDAHRRAAAAGAHELADDAAVAAFAGIAVTVFPGEPGNVKLTTADDFARAAREARGRLTDVRTGSGFDVHPFGDGDHVMLGGVRIAHARGLVGHSDADVVLHALTDAVLGALADGDIGLHFPPSEARWRGASSDRFLAFAIERVRARGGAVTLLDTTVLCEAPRIGPHREAMRARIAAIAGLPVARVAVKATTTERLGFLGRGEGIAALASATVRLPEDDEHD
jgi:2-C-methyl-D-erythritol 4-phosphate cytidylyltransferase/2-C-methyl-D-erythritol 2,4-cyclodiphosphate synthase